MHLIFVTNGKSVPIQWWSECLPYRQLYWYIAYLGMFRSLSLCLLVYSCFFYVYVDICDVLQIHMCVCCLCELKVTGSLWLKNPGTPVIGEGGAIYTVKYHLDIPVYRLSTNCSVKRVYQALWSCGVTLGCPNKGFWITYCGVQPILLIHWLRRWAEAGTHQFHQASLPHLEWQASFVWPGTVQALSYGKSTSDYPRNP